MSKNDLQTQRDESRRCNEHVLADAGFVKIGNSSLYKKDETAYILSPGIGKGKYEKYWFDVRLENIDKIEKTAGAKAWMLLRIVPNWFAFFPLSRIRVHMTQNRQDDRAHSGKVWGFNCELNEEKREIRIFAKNDETASYNTDLLDCLGAATALAQVEI